MGIYQDKLKAIIEQKKYTNNTEVDCASKESDVSWFYPLMKSLQAKKNGEMILHPSMQKLYEMAVQFTPDMERFVLSSPTGSGKSGVIYYLCIQWFKRMKEHNVFHLINPLNVLNDQTTYDLIFVLKKFIKNNNLKFKDFAIYLNRCDGDNAGKVLDNREEIPVFSFEKYSSQKRRKFELVISCVPSVRKIANAWKKEDCLSVIDEVHTIKYDDGIDENEDAIDVKWTSFWNNVNLYSAFIRGITATVTEEMFDREFGDMPTHMYKVSFNEALASGRVVMACPLFTQWTDNFSITQILKDQQKLNNKRGFGIQYHKILFTCTTNEEIAEIIFNNDIQGIFYISTSSFKKLKCRKTGDKIEVLEKDMSIPEFSNSIETLEEDCFVFHIRQLIAGVNVKGLTGCVLQTIESITDSTTTQQTIGRCLRKKGTKQAGIVTFLIENKNSDPTMYASKLKSISSLMDSMYGNNWIAAKTPVKKTKKLTGGGNTPTPPKGNNHNIPVTMSSFYMEVKTKINECKKRYELGVEKNIEGLKVAALNAANDVLNEYANKAVYGSQLERYNETKQKIVIECDWEPFAEYGDWVEL